MQMGAIQEDRIASPLLLYFYHHFLLLYLVQSIEDMTSNKLSMSPTAELYSLSRPHYWTMC